MYKVSRLCLFSNLIYDNATIYPKDYQEQINFFEEKQIAFRDRFNNFYVTTDGQINNIEVGKYLFKPKFGIQAKMISLNETTFRNPLIIKDEDQSRLGVPKIFSPSFRQLVFIAEKRLYITNDSNCTTIQF